MRRAGAARCAGSATRTSAGCSAARTWPTPRRYAKDLLADRDLRFISRTFPLWVAVGLALPFGLGVALTGIARRRAHRAAVGRRGAHLPPASRDLQHQLAVPLLRPAAVRHRRSSRATSPGWRRSPSARPGTTTTTPSRPRPGTAWAAGSSIPAPGSSPALERCHLAWDVVRISPGRQQAKRMLSWRVIGRNDAHQRTDSALQRLEGRTADMISPLGDYG